MRDECPHGVRMDVQHRCALCRWAKNPISRPVNVIEQIEDMTNACLHGEPRGSQYCALCRRIGLGIVETPVAEGEVLGAAEWERRAKRIIWTMARNGNRFTTEDVTDQIGFPDQTHRPNGRNNRVGALISSIARDYRIVIVDETKARNPQSNGRTLKVWMGREFR